MLAQSLVFAQNDSLVLLPAVEITAASLRNGQPGSFVEHWSGVDLAENSTQNIAAFLQNETGIYLKNYGAGSLSTVTIRGASASQTAVLWNGLQIQSPMLGQLDWSMLPVFFADEVSMQHGGNSAVWGSGAVGGAVLMENKPDFYTKKQLKIATGYGSFGNWHGQATAKFTHKKWASSTRLFYQKAKNNFQYKPTPSLPSKRQTNAAYHQAGLMHELYFRPSDKTHFGWQTWLQKSFREIPPTTTQTRSEANQADKTARTALNFRLSKGPNILQAKSALFWESIHFKDDQTRQDAQSHFWTNITGLDWQRSISAKLILQLSGNQSFTKAFIKSYADSSAFRQQSAVFSSLRYLNKKTKVQIDGRQELVDGKLIPFTPSLGVEQQVFEAFRIGAKICRNYRLPTLNDLHWQPGGNPELRPESGWSNEVNAQFSFQKNHSSLRFSSVVFNRNIKNWILWHPVSGQPIWSAANIAEVWSRGLENRFHFFWNSAKWNFKIDAGYDWVRSTNQIAVELPKIEAGQQLIYVPEHQGFTSINIRLGGLGLKYRHQFIGAVLTELGSLPSFQTGEFELDFEKTLAEIDSHFFFQIDNCWNANYRIVERRPMPGRSFLIGVSINY
ncbi:MAG: TonB-dependent receptor [Bacteroidetes bacterium]|nr:TonB-dependent receptor [Bacteroidota bacterium]